jgi:hypothetical protein
VVGLGVGLVSAGGLATVDSGEWAVVGGR